ncbi:MAG: hypothetical protein HY303_16460, partial [Candidatus Wallbacteria bacterium]|nr:hypothetical protein [Candidatus Wallbacteria bacterium]
MALATCLVLAAAGHYAWPAGPSVVADKSVFEPARGERVTFACQLECSGKLSLALCDGAHGVARTLAREEPLDAGGHAFTWDGELDGGSAAPVGTAYYPLLRLERTDGQIEQFDPAPSGGELLLLPDAATSYEQAAGVVRLTLPAAARVLARAGVRDGPVLATLSCWSAFPAGVSTIAWDGWDDSRVLQVPSRKGFFLSLKAVTLPSPCVVVRGRARPARVAPAGKVQWSERRLSLQKQLFAKS